MADWVKSHKVVSGIIAFFIAIGIFNAGVGAGANDAADSSAISERQSAGIQKIAYEEAGASDNSAFSAAILETLPDYSGKDFVILENNIPSFTEEELDAPYGTEIYGDLDSRGRATFAFAIVGAETKPAETQTRGDISSIKPSGWNQASYTEDLSLEHLYERSHLLAWRLTAEDANANNLITGTSHMNSEVMTQFEDKINDYVDSTGGHVAMKVTPHYNGNDNVAKGVQIEALSLEDGGKAVSLNVYCFNVQPGVDIDYATGASAVSAAVIAEKKAAEEAAAKTAAEQAAAEQAQAEAAAKAEAEAKASAKAEAERQAAEAEAAARANAEAQAAANSASNSEASQTYILNTNTGKFHYPGCKSVKQMSEKNKQQITASRSEVISMGYDPCGNCHP